MPNVSATCHCGEPGRPAVSEEPKQTSQSPAEELRNEFFEIWLSRVLLRVYGTVLSEPIPAEFLRIIEHDRARRQS
jgi:hypothetical protein